MKKKICVIGLGYIGLPTSAMFAQSGCEVVGVDVSEKVVNTLNQGQIHIEEPGLQEVIKKQVEEGNFRASLIPEKADAFIVAVPTPNLDDEFRSCDLSYVIQGVEKIIPYLEKGNTVIVESTIAPKSTDDCIKPILEKAGFEILCTDKIWVNRQTMSSHSRPWLMKINSGMLIGHLNYIQTVDIQLITYFRQFVCQCNVHIPKCIFHTFRQFCRLRLCLNNLAFYKSSIYFCRMICTCLGNPSHNSIIMTQLIQDLPRQYSFRTMR